MNLSFLLATQCCLLLILVLDFNNVLVYCQMETGLAPFWQHLLAALPTKILGLIQIGLLARLARNGGIGSNGMDDDSDGDSDETDGIWNIGRKRKKKKNVMVFLGKHNIQITNYGMPSEQMPVECYKDCGEEEEYNDSENDYNDDNYHYRQTGNRYRNNRYRKGGYRNGGRKFGRNRYRMGPNYRLENGYHKKLRNIKRKRYRKRPPKKYQKYVRPPIIDQYNSDEYVSGDYEDEEEEGDYGPTFLNYNPAINRRTHIWFPWLKNLLGQINGNVYNAVQKLSQKEDKIIVVPNGFPNSGTSDSDITGQSDSDSDFLKPVNIYEPSEDELKQLLSHPKVIEFLIKLNETLENESISDQLELNKRNIKQNNTLSFTVEDELSQTKQISQQLPNNYKRNVTNTTKSVLKVLKSIELNAESSQRSVKHLSDNEPQELSNAYQLEDYTTPYDEMAIDDDDQYTINTPYIRPNSYIDPEYQQLNNAYEGLGSSYGQQIGPVVGLNYWPQFGQMKPRKKKKKKKYYTTEKPLITTEDYMEVIQPPIKQHSTIQVIRTGPKYTNKRPEHNSYRRSLKGMVRGLPGFRSFFKEKDKQ